MDIFAFLAERMSGLVLGREFSFAENTTIGCGGIAEVVAYPRDGNETAKLLSLVKSSGIPHCFLGAGANVLPSDERFEGVVVRFSRMRTLFSDADLLYAGAGVTGAALLAHAEKCALSGFEPFAGIPMTVGGGTVMNAGISERHFSDLVIEVEGVENGALRRFSAKECRFGEKESIFQTGIAVTGVRFRAVFSAPERIAEITRRFRARRRKLPKGRSMGCTFVNPEGDSAGRLIDECGLKGLRVGGAHISDLHANFILNDGGSASDVSKLIDRVREEVYRQTGILLREEIRRIP